MTAPYAPMGDPEFMPTGGTNMPTPSGILNCIDAAYKAATDYPPGSDTAAAIEARKQSLAYVWTAMEGLAAMDDGGAFLVLSDVRDKHALCWLAASAVRELRDIRWVPPWPETADETDA